MKIDNHIQINNYPINLFKLIDLINIQFLKNKYYQQNNIKIGLITTTTPQMLDSLSNSLKKYLSFDSFDLIKNENGINILKNN